MAELSSPDRAALEQWLGSAGIDFEDCGRCEGLHLDRLRQIEGVIDSRLFAENYGLLLTTELEVRPMAVLAVSADLGRLNMDFPTLKVFLDIADDATPQLVVAGVLPAGAGLAAEQVLAFIELTLEETRTVAAQCLRLDYLFAEPESSDEDAGPALH